MPVALLGYWRVMREPGVLAFYFSAFLVRTASAMLPIALIVYLHAETDSFVFPGIFLAVVSVASAVSGPFSGKLHDRFGQRKVLLPRLLINTGSLMLLIVTVSADMPLWIAFVFALLIGATVPQMGSLARARWSYILKDSNLLETAFSLEAVTDDATFVIGPALATFIAALVHPIATLCLLAFLTLVGGITFLAGKRTEPPFNPDDRSIARLLTAGGAMRVKGMLPLAVSFVGLGGVFGAMQISIVAFAEHSGIPAAAGMLYGTFAAASILAGIGYGAISWRQSAITRLLLAFLFMAVGCLALAFVDRVAVMWLLVTFPGMAIAPAMITSSVLVNDIVPESVLTEAYTWLSSMTGLGIAIGASASGWLVEMNSSQGGFLIGALAAGFSCVLIVIARIRISRSKCDGRMPTA